MACTNATLNITGHLFPINEADSRIQDFVLNRIENELNSIHSTAQHKWLQNNGFKYGHPLTYGCLFWSKKYSGLTVELIWKPSPLPFWHMNIRNDFDNYAHIWNFPDDYDFNGFNSIIAFFDKECQPIQVEENDL